MYNYELAKISGYPGNLSSVKNAFALNQYITIECLRDSLKITVAMSDLQREIKIYVCKFATLIKKKKRRRKD